jgi:anti-anti-sigma factor
VAIRLDREKSPGLIELEGAIDIAGAAELKSVLVEALASARETRISLEKATSVDVTAVQMLWAAEREAKTSGGVLALEGEVPEAVRAALRAAGFERFPLADEPTNGGR